MSEEEAPTRITRTPVAVGSPYAGCWLFVVCGGVLLCMLSWGLFTFFKQSAQLDEFTDTAAQLLPVAKPEPAAITALEEKLTTFDKSVKAGQGGTLSLDTGELNTLFAAEKPFESVRSVIVFEGIDTVIHARVSLPMRTMKLEARWLNAVFDFVPGTKKDKGFYVDLKAITVPGKTVTPGFEANYKTGGYLDRMLVEEFREDKKWGWILRKFDDVKLESGKLVIETKPGPVPAGGPDAPPK